MSTFYGGPQLTSVTTYKGSLSTNANFTYTVPSGFWAEINYVPLNVSYLVNFSGVFYTEIRGTDPESAAKDFFSNGVCGSIILSSGNSFQAFGSDVAGTRIYFFTVKLYKNP